MSATPALPLYAGFWRRVAAYLLDSLVMIVPSFIATLFTGSELGAILQLLIWLAYKVLMEGGEMQATLGKRAMGIKVTGLDGERISYGRAVGRFFGSILSTIVLGIGFLMAAFTGKKQGLHDMLSSTLVVNAKVDAAQASTGTPAGTMPVTAGVWVAAIVMMFIPMLGIVAAIAIPAYQDYVVRAKMFEVVNAASAARAEAAEEIMRARAEGAAKGIRTLPSTSKYVSRVQVDRGAGAIRVVIDAKALGTSQVQPGAELLLVLSKDGAEWQCGASGVPKRYLPASCRR